MEYAPAGRLDTVKGEPARYRSRHRWTGGLHRPSFDARAVLGPAAAVLVTAAAAVPLLLGYANPPHRGTVVQLPGICSYCAGTPAPSESPLSVPPVPLSVPKIAATSRPPRQSIPAPAVPPPVVKTTPTGPPPRTVCPQPRPSRTR